MSTPHAPVLDQAVNVALVVLAVVVWLGLTAYLDRDPTETDAAKASAQSHADSLKDARMAARSAHYPFVNTEESHP